MASDQKAEVMVEAFKPLAEAAGITMLKGEGKTRIQVQRRRECEVCGEPATHKITFLLDGARGNPASAAYRRDDCSRCSDEDHFACAEHKEAVRRDPPGGMGWCSTIAAAERYPHMLLHWVTILDPFPVSLGHAARPTTVETK